MPCLISLLSSRIQAQLMNSLLLQPAKMMMSLQGANADRSIHETAYPWRDSLYETQYYYPWTSGDQSGQPQGASSLYLATPQLQDGAAIVNVISKSTF